MDSEEKKRRQFVKVILAETLMAVSVIAIVVVTLLLVMGFSISQGGGIEQTGLMQVHSQPTGATVELDGNVLFSRTNTSRTMSAGEHHLKLSRDGYDTWEKDVTMYSGVLIRVYYPRLFLQNRVAETVLKLSGESAKTKELEFYATAPSRNYVIYAEKDATSWQLLDLRGDEVKRSTIDLSSILPGTTSVEVASPSADYAVAGDFRFDGTIELLKWSNNDEKILLKVAVGDQTEWVLLNLRNVAASLNLTKTFGLNFDQVEIIDSSASQLYALAGHRLYRVNVAGEVLSRILVDDVESFVNRGTRVVYLTTADTESQERTIGSYRDDEKTGTALITVPSTESVHIALSHFYDEDYLAYIVDQKLTIYYGTLPSYNENRDRPATDDLKKLLDEVELERVPEHFSFSRDGEFLVARDGRRFMVTDLETGDLWSYEAETAELNWFDASMMYTVKSGEIIVWDFDGTNLRNLAESAKTAKGEAVQAAGNYPVMLTANNRWLYYLVEGENTYSLTRERVQ